MRVVAMFRVSTEKQANEGASLDAQERQFHEIALRSGWEIAATFRGCESATQASRERAVLQEVLACIRRLEPDAIYVHEQSRLTRGDELEVAGLLRELRERRMKIILGGVVRDLSSLDERFMVGIQSLVDRAEAERIKERHQRGKKEKALRGLKNSGPAPYGYHNPRSGDPNRGQLQVVPAEATVVRRIFDLACEGRSIRAIAAMLTSEGLDSPRGGKWGKTTVLRVLSNPAYRGCHVTGGWVAEPGSRTFRFNPDHPDAIVVENAHEPIVDPEVWLAAQAVQPAPCTARPRMLTGLMSMNGFPATGDSERREPYYRPPRGVQGGPWLPVRLVDRVVWDAFVKAISEPEFLETVVSEAREAEADGRSEAERAQLAGQLAKLDGRLGRLTDMRADGEITADEFRKRSEECREQARAIKKQLAAAEQRASQRDGEWIRKMFAAARLLVSSERSLGSEERRRVLVRAVRHVEVKARKNPLNQGKDAQGRFIRAAQAAWQIESVSFEMVSTAADRDQQSAITG